MSVSADLQAVITRLKVAHAGGKTYGKTELGALGRELCLIRDEAQLLEARTVEAATVVGGAFAALTDALGRNALEAAGGGAK